MQILLPRPGRIDSEWFRFLRDVAEALGFTRRITYVDAYFSVNESLAAAGTTTFVVDWKLPGNYKDGTPISFWVDWYTTAGAAGAVVFDYEVLKGDYETALASAASGSETTENGTTASLPIRTSFDDIDGDGLAKGDILRFSISRDGDDADDDQANAAVALGMGVKYVGEGIGWDNPDP